ncbi:methylamine utilization protein [Methylophilus aquaticus]|uniref:Methylamine utilization protein n=1 Tax=Methylophilus aquaticus TaxID=1971610 RepID=A0ABT9JP02_9PROT|nr:methylamine utilization protein [Methylophilus aquaticus]
MIFVYVGWWIVTGIFAIPLYAAEVTFTVTDATGKPFPDAVVALFDGKSAALTTTANTKIVQKNKQFNPGVTVVQTGTLIHFPNEDTVRHHVYSFSPAKKFELKLYRGVAANPVQFDQAGVVSLGCNIHDSMIGYIYVLDTPFFAKTDSQGQAVLTVADGQYTYQVWPAGRLKPSVEQKQHINGATAIKVNLP